MRLSRPHLREGNLSSSVIARSPKPILSGVKTFGFFFSAKILGAFNPDPQPWLVSERPDEARDNGYHFFRYVRLHHPHFPIYYTVTPDSVDLGKVAPLGQVIHWGSYAHHQIWLRAACVISAHAGKCSPDPHLSWRLSKWGLASHASVFLQHGVTAINCADFMLRSEAQHDLISAAGAPERDFLVKHAGHPDHVPQMLGFCRFDSLHEPVETRRQVLLMPTWRRWFRGLIQAHGKAEATRIFKESAYFKALNGLLASPALHQMLEKQDFDLILYPHYGVQEYLAAFTPSHPRIRIADRHDHDVQQLLKESAVLITDFSSVSFDFAYMGKPLVYLLPDEEQYFANHFQRGYFDFDRDGFGPVTRDPEAAVEALGEILRRECRQELVHAERVDSFFPLRDDRNCERTFDAIQELLAKRRARG